MSGGDMGYFFHCFSFTGALTYKEVLTVTFKLLSSTKIPTKRHASPICKWFKTVGRGSSPEKTRSNKTLIYVL